MSIFLKNDPLAFYGFNNVQPVAILTSFDTGPSNGVVDWKKVESGAEMKADIHPDYHEITVVMSDGTEFKTRSTYGENGASIRLDIDPTVHPAWTGGNTHLVDTGGRVGRFNKRFGNFGLKK